MGVNFKVLNVYIIVNLSLQTITHKADISDTDKGHFKHLIIGEILIRSTKSTAIESSYIYDPSTNTQHI